MALTLTVLPEGRGARVVVDDGGGLRGEGACMPLPGISPDSTDDCVVALRAIQLPAQAPASLVEIAATVAQIDDALPAARHALESALLACLAGALGRPVWSVLAGPGAAPRAVAISALVDPPDPDAARDATARGLRTIKLKLGRRDWADELDAARAVAAAVPAARLRFDVNRAWTLAEATARLDALASFAPDLVEEPCGAGLAALPGAPVPLAADESLATDAGRRTALELIAAGRVAAVVMKPMLLGGALACLALARQAARAGGAAVVTHMHDGPLALASARALALALAATAEVRLLPCGLDRPGGPAELVP